MKLNYTQAELARFTTAELVELREEVIRRCGSLKPKSPQQKFLVKMDGLIWSELSDRNFSYDSWVAE